MLFNLLAVVTILLLAATCFSDLGRWRDRARVAFCVCLAVLLLLGLTQPWLRELDPDRWALLHLLLVPRRQSDRYIRPVLFINVIEFLVQLGAGLLVLLALAASLWRPQRPVRLPVPPQSSQT